MPTYYKSAKKSRQIHGFSFLEFGAGWASSAAVPAQNQHSRAGLGLFQNRYDLFFAKAVVVSCPPSFPSDTK
jgi:hypothetical protein